MSKAKSAGRPPDHILRSPILRYIWRRMNKQNKNFMVAIVGDPGDGKSWAALRLAELIDPDFHVGKVTFTPKELVERVNDDQPAGDITVADESGVSLNAKTWWESEQIQIGNILETWRHQNRGLIFTLPVLNKLQKDARGLLHALMTAYGINKSDGSSTWRFQIIDQNNVTGDIYRPYPRLPDPQTGEIKKWKKLELLKPSKGLRESYQERKREFTANLNEEVLESLEEQEREKEAEARSLQDIAQDIAENGIAKFVSRHGQTNRPYINKELL